MLVDGEAVLVRAPANAPEREPVGAAARPPQPRPMQFDDDDLDVPDFLK